jgi:hypothetical protein
MHALNRNLIVLALGAAFFSPALLAAPPAAKAPAAKAAATATVKDPAAPGKGDWWKAADVNADGKLSLSESAANAGLSTRFATIDSDKDGFVTNEEYRAFYTSDASKSETHAAAHSSVVTRDVWLKLDANADTRISLEEAKANADLTGAFTDVDLDSDGFITQAEYTAFAKTK